MGKLRSFKQASLHSSKRKFSQVKCLKTKALDYNLDHLKIPCDSIQDIMLLYSNKYLSIHAGTNGFVEIPKFDNNEEIFRGEHFLVP